MLTIEDFRPYQNDGLRFIEANNKAGLFIKMGGGKTGVLLRHATNLINNYEIRKVLIISTVANTQATWVNEIDQWDFSEEHKIQRLRDIPNMLTVANHNYHKNKARLHTEWLTKLKKLSWNKAINKLKYSKRGTVKRFDYDRLYRVLLPDLIKSYKERLKQKLIKQWYEERAHDMNVDFDTINVENLRKFVPCFNEKNWVYDMVIIDESTLFKNNKSIRFKALKQLMHLPKYVYLLSGSPAPNGLLPLWAQMYLLDQGERLGKTITGFKANYFQTDYMGYNLSLKQGANKIIKDQIKDICIFIDPSENMDTLEPIVTDVLIELPKKTRGIYKQMLDDLVIDLIAVDKGRSSGGAGISVEAANAAVKAGKLKQICNGFVYDDEGHPIPLHDEKLERLKEIVESAEGMPILVAVEFKYDKEVLLKAFKGSMFYTSGSTQIINDWNDGKIPMLIMNPKSGGHGLSLQHGSNICVWYGITWSLELYLQFNERIGAVRQFQSGYNRPVYYHRIIAMNSIEDKVVAPRLETKTSIQETMLESLKRLM